MATQRASWNWHTLSRRRLHGAAQLRPGALRLLGSFGCAAALAVFLAAGAAVAAGPASPPGGDPDKPAHHTINSPQWLRLCAAACSTHPFPAGLSTPFLRYYTDPMRATEDNPLWKPTFGEYFEYVMPYQGLPGVVYVPAGWATPKVGQENSVKNVNYKAVGKVSTMMHHKGVWYMMHVPAQQWWGATSAKESSPEGALYLNMQLLSLPDPVDGFNFDAWLEYGADIAAIRKKADEVLSPGHYIMHAESHVADPPGFNTHYMYLFGRRVHCWEDRLHGMHYLWFAIRGLKDHGTSPAWGRKLFKLMLWDCMFWGGASPFADLPPANYYDRNETQQLVGLLKLSQRHSDLLGLVKAPTLLPRKEVLQDNLAVNVFDGSAPTYFPVPDSPGGDKRLYAFKTGGAPIPFGDSAYYETMPPVPAQPPRGDLLVTKHQEGYHFVSAGIDGSWRTPTRRDGDKVIVGCDALARYGTFPGAGQTIYVVRYRNILNVGRSDGSTIQVRVNKAYKENLLVELEFRRTDLEDHTIVISRPVINQEVRIDLQRDLGVEQLHPGDQLHVRLLREHPLDRWHIPVFLCDEVILSGSELGLYATIRGFPKDRVARGAAATLEAEVGNDSDKPKTIALSWQLPPGWTVQKGSAAQKLQVQPHKVLRVSVEALVGEAVPYGGQKIGILADPAQRVDGLDMSLGMDSRLVVVAPTDLPKAPAGRVEVSVETGGFAGISGVTIPVTHELPPPPEGMIYKVVEYDAAGQIVGDKIVSEYLPIDEKHGLVSWMVLGNDQAFRNFCIYATKEIPPDYGKAKLMIATGGMDIGPGTAASDAKFKYGTFEIKMAMPPSKEGDAYVGVRSPIPEGWSSRRFDPDRPVSMMAWYFKGLAHPVVAVFDNGSGMPEVSSGKQIEVKGLDTPIDCDKAWGDYGWTAGNDRLDRFTCPDYRTYRLEWQRLYQRWYIDGQLVYERQIALDEPLPLVIENRTKDHKGVAWIRITSPYCRK